MHDKTVPLPHNDSKRFWKENDVVTCVKSASRAYTEGKTYTVSLDEAGKKGLVGNDGLFDHLTLLVSAFRHPGKEEPTESTT